MKIEKEKISNINNNQVFKITFTNENNYIVSFYNFGGYINNIFIPYKNNLDKHEDVLLGYKNFEDYIKDRSYLFIPSQHRRITRLPIITINSAVLAPYK